MKILHLSQANIIITIALSSIALTYFIRFSKKNKKTHLDILKLFWVLTTCIISDFIFLHLISKDYVIISRSLFCITLIDFCLIEYNVIKER